MLGSGLNSLVQEPPRGRTISYTEIDGLPPSTVKGTRAGFVLTTIGGVRVVVLPRAECTSTKAIAQWKLPPVSAFSLALGSND